MDADTGAVLRKEYVYNSPDVSFKNRSHAGGRGEAGGRKHGKGSDGKGSDGNGSGTTDGQSTDETQENSVSGAGTI